MANEESSTPPANGEQRGAPTKPAAVQYMVAIPSKDGVIQLSAPQRPAAVMQLAPALASQDSPASTVSQATTVSTAAPTPQSPSPAPNAVAKE